MKITLTRTGGIVPMKKQAETIVDWSAEELKSLTATIKSGDDPGEARDSTAYSLSTAVDKFWIDWSKIPAEYKQVFEQLKANLKVVKQP